MRLPRLEQALIDPEKLSDYLLSPDHDRGRFKAALFATMGYGPENWRRLESDIRSMIAACDATPAGTSAHGQKFVVTGCNFSASGFLGRPRWDSAIRQGRQQGRFLIRRRLHCGCITRGG